TLLFTGANVEADERRPLGWSFLYFFCLLCGYYMLRPVRDEMAIEGGVQHLPWMMTGTFLTLLVATPLFGWLSSKWPRVRLLFGVMAAGGSLGAIAGPGLTAAVTYLLPIPSLMLCSALWLTACMVCIDRLDRWPRSHTGFGEAREALGGGMWAGIRLAAGSSYL